MIAPSTQTPNEPRQFAPPRQLAPGTFDVISRNRSNGTPTLVGHVYVVGAGSNVIVEHWALSPAYGSPDSSQDMAVERRSQGYGSMAAFVSAMHDIEAQGNFTFSYVHAECTNYTTLPS